MELIDRFNELIVEHGSSVVQEKHIALFRDQLSLADKKIFELEFKVSNLNIQLEKAKSAIQKLTKENEEQNTIINNLNREKENLQNKSFHNTPLEDTEIKILKKIFETAQTEKSLSEYTNLSYEHVQYYLEKLIAKNAIRKARLGTGTTLYSIEQSGREYLIQNGLI